MLKEDVAVLKEEVAILKEDVATLKIEVAVLKKDMTCLKKEIKRVDMQRIIDKEEIIQEYKQSQDFIGRMFAEQNLRINKLEQAVGII